ncbi:MAG: hypothetical protein RLZZ262_1564 [Bacteroidota bacterium]|jgi:hypothetical protein
MGALIALCLYPPMIRGILTGTIQQSLATWALWVSLDLIAMFSVIIQKGNWLILACYISGGSLVTLGLIYKKYFKWTWFESLVLVMVVICLVVWWFSGSWMATIASTIAVVISGFPQVKDSWSNPDKKTGHIYLWYAVANALSFFGGKSWSIEDRFYPGMCVPLCVFIGIISFRSKEQASVKHE